VVAQTFRDFEVIVIDDASTDSSRGVVLDYLRQEKCGRLISLPQRVGVAAAINAGLERSDSEFVARLDSDDLMAPDRLAQQVAAMTHFSRVGVLGSWVTTFGLRKMHLRFPKSHNEIMLEMGFRNAIAHPSVLIRRQATEGLTGPYRPEFINTEDWDLWLRISRKFELANIPSYLTRYRIHAGQISRNQNPRVEPLKSGLKSQFRETVNWQPLWARATVSPISLIIFVLKNQKTVQYPLVLLLKVGARVLRKRACRRVLKQLAALRRRFG
jgi:Glycosyltransferases involved in cell wall biogenesis